MQSDRFGRPKVLLKVACSMAALGTALSIVILLFMAVLYPELRSRGFLKDPVRNGEKGKSFQFATVSGEVVYVNRFEDALVSAAMVSEGDESDASDKRNHASPFSKDLLTRVFTQARTFASSSQRTKWEEPFGVLFGFGVPCRSACYGIAMYSGKNYGSIESGFSVYPNWGQTTLSAPFNLIVPLAPLWYGVVVNALFWTAACSAARWILLRFVANRCTAKRKALQISAPVVDNSGG
jgi:hypothetical protein